MYVHNHFKSLHNRIPRAQYILVKHLSFATWEKEGNTAAAAATKNTFESHHNAQVADARI
jgi:hypothetical protein